MEARPSSEPLRPSDLDAAVLALASLGHRTDRPDHALQEILDLIAATLRADSGLIALLSPDSGRLEVEAQLALPPAAAVPFLPGQGVPGWVALHGQPVRASAGSTDHRLPPLRPGVACEMAVPLLAAGGQVLGVICLDRARLPAFGPDDLAALERLGGEAGRVMQRLWHLDHLQGKARQLEALLATGQSLVSKLEQHELLATLARDAQRVMRARACVLYLCEPGGAAVRPAACSGAAEPPPFDPLPIDSCLVAAAIHTRRPVAFADVQSPEFLALADLPRDRALRSALAIPLAFEGEVLGVLAVFLDRVHRFDDDEKRLCQALASLGAVALQNARLYTRVFHSEESLRKNEQLTMLGLLTAEIAHEIRNPLTVLKLLHGGLGADFPEGDPRRTDLRVIGEKLDQLESIVTRVLNFGQAPSSLHTRCELGDIVADTLVLVRLKLAQNQIRLSYDRPAQPLVVNGHKGQLQQVLLNLLLNALPAMPDGGQITLTLKSDLRGAAPVASLDVADTGSGIDPALRDRIFDSFLSGRPGGTGLGLAIAKRLLLSHNGDIALLATGAGGTTFQITLPLAKT